MRSSRTCAPAGPCWRPSSCAAALRACGRTRQRARAGVGAGRRAPAPEPPPEAVGARKPMTQAHVSCSTGSTSPASTRCPSTSGAAATRAAQGARDVARGGRQRDRGLRPARPRRRRLPHGPEGRLPAEGRDRSVPRLQRRRVRARDLQGPRAHAEDAAHADRGDRDRDLRRRRSTARSSTSAASTCCRPRCCRRRSRRREQAGYLGENILGSGHALKLVLHRGAGAYICGEETGLLDSLEGKRGNPRLKPPFPAIQGLYQGPTLINNVETLCDGAAHHPDGRRGVREDRHRDLDRHEAHLDLWRRAAPRQLRDRARHPQPRDHLRARGRPGAGHQIKMWFPGGSSSPVLTADDLDLAYDFDTMAKAGHDARLGRDHHRRRPPPRARCGAEAREVLLARVLRQVRALS